MIGGFSYLFFIKDRLIISYWCRNEIPAKIPISAHKNGIYGIEGKKVERKLLVRENFFYIWSIASLNAAVFFDSLERFIRSVNVLTIEILM
jgi:hypothetical protein